MENDFEKPLSFVPLPLRDICTKVITEIHKLRGTNPSSNKAVSNQIVNIIHQNFDVYSVNLYLVQDSGVVLQAGTGEESQSAIKHGHKLDLEGQSLVGRAIVSGQPQIALTEKQEIRFPSFSLPPIHSELVVPLKTQKKSVGVGALDIQSSEYDAFDEKEIVVFQIVADEIAKILFTTG